MNTPIIAIIIVALALVAIACSKQAAPIPMATLTAGIPPEVFSDGRASMIETGGGVLGPSTKQTYVVDSIRLSYEGKFGAVAQKQGRSVGKPPCRPMDISVSGGPCTRTMPSPSRITRVSRMPPHIA